MKRFENLKTHDEIALVTISSQFHRIPISRSNEIFENQPTTMTKTTRRVAHDDRLAPSYLLLLVVRLVMELSYVSSCERRDCAVPYPPKAASCTA